jgi:hypothetical protein
MTDPLLKEKRRQAARLLEWARTIRAYAVELSTNLYMDMPDEIAERIATIEDEAHWLDTALVVYRDTLLMLDDDSEVAIEDRS